MKKKKKAKQTNVSIQLTGKWIECIRQESARFHKAFLYYWLAEPVRQSVIVTNYDPSYTFGLIQGQKLKETCLYMLNNCHTTDLIRKSLKFLPFSDKELNIVPFVSSFFKTNASKFFPFSYCAVNNCSPYWPD